MMYRTCSKTKVSGFSLIEALVALAVFSFGLLAIAKFQVALVADSSQSKARSEAVQLAQKKLDELRNYTTEPQLVANLMGATQTNTHEFPTNVIDGTYPTTAEAIPGNNADFTRQWSVACSGDNCTVVALVRWTDIKAGPQLVSLDTRLTWKAPGGAVDLAVNDFTPLVPSATGRAYLGDGTVTQAQLNAGIDNNDGTVSIANVGDDRVLVDTTNNGDDTYNIVLTLKDACVTDTCIDFVKIKGKVFRDTVDAPGVALSALYVLASDAAYCARQTAATTTPAGSYEYYDYTCYLGGGWHGNVGVIGASGNDRICMGDPLSPNTDDGYDWNNWYQTEMASRRVYRGMTFIGDATTGVLPAGTLYYSQGIADAVELPDPGDKDGNGDLIPYTSYRFYGHHYVATRITGNPTGSDCVASLSRPDADTNGDGDLYDLTDLFRGVASDFVCLNNERVPGTFKYLDTFQTGQYAKSFCPYDPSRGPALAYYISGTVSAPSGSVLGSSAIANSVTAENCNFVTSLADLNNLTVQDVSALQSSSYACMVYDWGNGWTGSVFVNPGTGLDCGTPLPFTAIGGSRTGQDIACTTVPVIGGTITASGQTLDSSTMSVAAIGATGHNNGSCTFVPATGVYACTVATNWLGSVELTTSLSGCPTGTSYTTAVTGPVTQDYACLVPTEHTLNGDITGSAWLDVSGYTSIVVAPSPGDLGGTCSPTTYDAANYTLSYTCTVTETDGSWSGSVTVTPPPLVPPVSCTVGTVAPGDPTVTTSSCIVDRSGPFILEGTVTSDDKGAELISTTVSIAQTAGTTAVVTPTITCDPSTVLFAASASGGPFTGRIACTVDVLPDSTTWEITVTYTTNKFICTGVVATGVVSLTEVYTTTPDGKDLTVDISRDLQIRKQERDCLAIP